ncbi:hypothetical protein IJO12_00305 [bacterium]|nr:hypothetical protein [bacterium]
MGLADRFRQNLEKRDIFQDFMENETLEDQKFKYTSKPSAFDKPLQAKNFDSVAKLEDLETRLISKIKNTPYWNEYSKKEQSEMIGAYFDRKLSTKNYQHINYMQKDKISFIQNILNLLNNK